MPVVPQSEIQVKFSEEIFKETHEKRGEILAKFSVDFRPSISREIGHKKFHTNSSTHQELEFHTAEPKFDTLGVGGPKKVSTSGDGCWLPKLMGEVRPSYFARTPFIPLIVLPWEIWKQSGKKKRAQRLTFGVRRPPGGVEVFHAKGWWPKSSCPPSKVCLPWVSKRGAWDVPRSLPGCPGPLRVFKKFMLKMFVCIFRSLNKGAFRFPGVTRDHFRCTVEPSSGHVQCRFMHRWKPDQDDRKGTQKKVMTYPTSVTTSCSKIRCKTIACEALFVSHR